MHFALPPRKTSHPPPYTRTHRSTPVRRKQLQFGAIIACAALALIYLATRLFAESPERTPPGTPETVVVTLMDPDGMSKEYISRITENRKHYAAKHGLYLAKPWKRSKSNRTPHRLRLLLPQCHRLRHWQFPSKLGSCPCSPSRHDSISLLHLLLYPLTSRTYHEPLLVPKFAHHGAQTYRVNNAQGQACRSAGQCDQDILASEGRQDRFGAHAG